MRIKSLAAFTAVASVGLVPLVSGVVPAAEAATRKPPSGISAKSALLVDSKGKTLYGKKSTTRRAVGSTTKVLTALLVIKAGKLDRKVTVKKKWVDYVKGNDASSAGLKTGDKLTRRQLLNGMMLPSGCDAAYGLADILGPGQTKFVAKMNKAAKAYGLKHTHFVNADGLPTKSHKEGYSTAADMVKLARAALKNKTFAQVVGHQKYTVKAKHKYVWHNTNTLLGRKGTFGIKTGHTNKAGYCLLFAAKRGGRVLVGIVLGDSNTSKRFTEAAKLIDWGFGGKRTELRLRTLPSGAPTD